MPSRLYRAAILALLLVIAGAQVVIAAAALFPPVYPCSTDLECELAHPTIAASEEA